MASNKADKPVGTQSSVAAKKEPAKALIKPAASKPAPKISEVKPRETKKKVYYVTFKNIFSS